MWLLFVSAAQLTFPLSFLDTGAIPRSVPRFGFHRDKTCRVSPLRLCPPHCVLGPGDRVWCGRSRAIASSPNPDFDVLRVSGHDPKAKVIVLPVYSLLCDSLV